MEKENLIVYNKNSFKKKFKRKIHFDFGINLIIFDSAMVINLILD